MIDELVQQTSHVIERVRQRLPKQIPRELANRVLEWLKDAALKLAL